MKRSLLLLAAVCLASCQKTAGEPYEAAGLNGSDRMTIWTDPQTKCRYYLYSSMANTNMAIGGMAPRYRADGKPDCENAR